MKHNLFTKERDITNWLDKHNVPNYTLREDEKYGYIVDVRGHVFLNFCELNCIQVKFGHIEGSFNCSENSLTTLLGAPDSVSGYFTCDTNKLTSLQYCPQFIKGNFNCTHNLLSSLIGGPQIIEGDFGCGYNPLKTLKGAPQTVGKSFYCNNSGLTSLKYCPQHIGDKFAIFENNLSSIDFLPQSAVSILLDANPLLGYLQSIVDFKEIQSIVEKDKLNALIPVCNTYKNNKI